MLENGHMRPHKFIKKSTKRDWPQHRKGIIVDVILLLNIEVKPLKIASLTLAMMLVSTVIFGGLSMVVPNAEAVDLSRLWNLT